VRPDVGHRHRDVLGEGAGAIDTDAQGVFAQVAAAGQAIAAASAHDVAFGADDFTGKKSLTLEPTFDYLANELVPYDHRHRDGLLRPLVPFVNVQVGAQMPVRSTRMSTSLMPVAGWGTSSSQRPGRRSFLTRAFIIIRLF